MLESFISEFIGAIVQLIVFSSIPLIFWLIFVRKKQNFFEWIGMKKVRHEGKWRVTVCAILIATGMYIGLTTVSIRFLPEGVTIAGSSFAGKGSAAFPAVLAYSFIRTGLSEEIVFRGFLLKRFSEKLGFTIGNTLQALLFGMMHGIPFGIATHSMPERSYDVASRSFWMAPGVDERKKMRRKHSSKLASSRNGQCHSSGIIVINSIYRGLMIMKVEWFDGFEIKAVAENNEIVISANREGLLSLAKHLKALADGSPGDHLHYDEYNSLKEGSTEIIIERVL